MIADIQEFTASVDPVWQWMAVMAAGAIPFVESYGAGPIGIVVGVVPILAILAAIVGNIVSMAIVVVATSGARDKLTNADKPQSPRRQRFVRAFDKWGVPGVSLLGQWILPSQITSSIMVGVGASKQNVIVWQIISIIVWGVAFGALAWVAVAALRG
jgi:hypothetical protein